MSNTSLWLGPIALLPLLALPAIPALAQADTGAAQRLFGCAIGPADGNMTTLNAIEDADGAWHDLQVIIAEPGRPKILVPPRPVSGKDNFFFANSDGPEGYFASVRFAFSGTSYVLNMLDIPPSADGNDMGGRAASLGMTNADGTHRDLHCGETEDYIGYMAEAMSCDMTNPHGQAGCDFDTRPTRTANDKLPPGFGN